MGEINREERKRTEFLLKRIEKVNKRVDKLEKKVKWHTEKRKRLSELEKTLKEQNNRSRGLTKEQREKNWACALRKYFRKYGYA